jgi:predicted SAM-dependent methyltransferase
MDKMIKKILNSTGLIPAILSINGLIRQLMSRSKWSVLKKQDRIYLELGSGPKKGNNGWTTIDFSGADISHDLRKGIPLPDNSVDRIYTSHVFEHISFNDLISFINECYRVLKREGELSVCVPNAGLYIRSYIAGQRFRSVEKCYTPAVVETGSLIDQVNYIAYMDGQHKYMFDDENLLNILRKAPFSQVYLRDFDIAIDLKSRDFESVYAKAIK